MTATLWVLGVCTVINAINIAWMVTEFVRGKRWRDACRADLSTRRE